MKSTLPEPDFDWNQLAFGSKSPINDLKATFIAAPRELSVKRFTQLLKQYLPQGNIVLGIAKERYIDGFDDQEQFRTLELSTVQSLIEKVNAQAGSPNIYSLAYFQRDLQFLLDKLHFKRAVFVNGSWHHSFHLRPEYYRLTESRTPYELLSPFASADEAAAYANAFDEHWQQTNTSLVSSAKIYSVQEILELNKLIARESFDHTHQIGVILARPEASGHQVLATATNRVVPYQTYAMHNGSLREQYFSPANDLNYYDTIHAEMELLVQAQKQRLDLAGTSLFINVLPCPTCARTLSRTDITEIVYSQDHSAGYALKLLEASGKTVRRIV